MEHLTSGHAVLLDDGGEAAAASGEQDDEIVVQIKELLETRVRPAVAQDGGDIIFHDFTDGVVYLHMQGSCSGLPELDRDAQGRHREHAAPLHPRGTGSPRHLSFSGRAGSNEGPGEPALLPFAVALFFGVLFR